MSDIQKTDLQGLVGERLGPYNSFNPVSRVQVWQWCSAMGDASPLCLNEEYQSATEFSGNGVVAPPAMMKMWTMRDFDDNYAPGSTSDHPYEVMHELEQLGFPTNVAVSYDTQFHRYLVEGDRVHHYKSVVSISDLKTTALGRGYFFTDRMEYLDQDGEMFAEALITYFQYQPVVSDAPAAEQESAAAKVAPAAAPWTSNHLDQLSTNVAEGDELPQLAIPISHRLIAGGAIATLDFIPVYHNVPATQAAPCPIYL